MPTLQPEDFEDRSNEAILSMALLARLIAESNDNDTADLTSTLHALGRHFGIAPVVRQDIIENHETYRQINLRRIRNGW